MSSNFQRSSALPTMGGAVEPYFAQEDLLSMGDMLAMVWKRRWVVLIVGLIAAAVGWGLSVVVAKKYDAAVIIGPVSEDSSAGRLGGLGSLVSQIGGLGSLAGLSIGGNEHKAESLAILQSESLSERFIQERNLLPVLFPTLWDPVQQKWKTSDPDKKPTVWKAYQRFKSIRRITIDTKTGLVTVTVRWKDATVAADWANSLVAMCNDAIRARAIVDAERNIAYLNEQLTKATIVAMQNSISALLESEIRKVMLAKGSQEYAFRVLDPAIPPEKPAFPVPTLWTAVGFLGGAMIASIIVLLRSIYTRGLRPAGSAPSLGTAAGGLV
jgi:uncharacterized protein involved in exopolysaccharide biosynthesis